MNDPVQFVAAVLTLLLTPGPTNTLMAAAGGSGRHSPLALIVAELAGYLSIVTLARLVLLPLIDLYPPAGIAMKLAVVGYLIYAAVKLWRGGLPIGSSDAPIGPGAVFVTTFLNPKGLILALSVFPSGDEHLLAYYGVFALLVGACGWAWFTLGRGLARLARGRASLLPRVASVAFLVFAALLGSSLAR
jgi:threonine/homoserine/homoserine lactone efflux protein